MKLTYAFKRKSVDELKSNKISKNKICVSRYEKLTGGSMRLIVYIYINKNQVNIFDWIYKLMNDELKKLESSFLVKAATLNIKCSPKLENEVLSYFKSLLLHTEFFNYIFPNGFRVRFNYKYHTLNLCLNKKSLKRRKGFNTKFMRRLFGKKQKRFLRRNRF